MKASVFRTSKLKSKRYNREFKPGFKNESLKRIKRQKLKATITHTS